MRLCAKKPHEEQNTMIMILENKRANLCFMGDKYAEILDRIKKRYCFVCNNAQKLNHSLLFTCRRDPKSIGVISVVMIDSYMICIAGAARFFGCLFKIFQR